MQKQIFHIEKLRKITLYGILLLVFLIISLVVLLQTSYIQTKIAKYIVKELSLTLKTEINIQYAKISLFRGIVIKEFNIKDRQKDTLLYVKELSIIPSGLQTDFNDLTFNKIRLSDLYFNLYEFKKDSSNLGFILDFFKSDSTDTEDKGFRLEVDRFELVNSKVRYHLPDTVEKQGFNSKDIKIKNLNINFENFIFNREGISAHNLNVAFKEKSGIEIQKSACEFLEVSPEYIKLNTFSITTSESALDFDTLNLYYPKGYIFSNFSTNLKTDISIHESSHISYNDIKPFINDSSDFNETVNLSGKIKGSLDDLTVDYLDINYQDIFEMKIHGEIKNLYTSKDPSFNINVEKFSTDIEKIKNIGFKGKEHYLTQIPKELENIKTLNYSGDTKGKLSKFDTSGEISGNFGSIVINASAKSDSISGMNITGMFSAKDIDLSQPMGDKDFGILTFSQDIDLTISKNKNITLVTSGLIEELLYKNFSYKDIRLFMEIKDKKIDSLDISFNQSEFMAEIFGNIDFTNEIPEINIVADIRKADLKRLNFEKADKKSDISFCLNAFFSGVNLDDFTGMIYLSKSLKYQRDTVSFILNRMELSGNMIKINDNISKKIELTSDIADISLISNGKASEIINSFKTFISGFFQIKSDSLTIFSDTITQGSLTLEGIIKDAKGLTNLYLHDLNISNNSAFFGNYDPGKNIFNFSFNSSDIAYKDFQIKDFYAVAYTRENRFYAGTGGSSMKAFNPVYIENLSFEGDFKNDSVNFNLSWNNYNDTAFYAGDINGMLSMLNTNEFKGYIFQFNDSKIILKENIWSFSDSKISIDSSKININELSFKNKTQEIYIDGNVSKNPGDILYTRFKNFSIQNFNELLPKSFKITGNLYGSAIFAQLYDNPLVFTKDSVLDLTLNDIDFGNFYINSIWDDQNNKIHSNAYNLKGSKKQFMNDTIYADYWPDTDSINVTADIRSMTLQTFKQYFEDYVEFNNTAYITGMVNLYGKLDDPKYECQLKLKQTSFKIKYLNTVNTFEEPDIYIDNQMIRIEDTKVRSNTKNGYTYLNGIITHKNFSEMYLDINLKPDNFIITDLNETDSSYFYGKSIASGNINISGPLDDIYLDADLTTENNTNIFIPISTSENLNEENNYIRFIKDTVDQKKMFNIENYNFETSGFSMNIKLNVTPDAEIVIKPYEGSGDITTKGEGKLTLDLNREGDFNMYGTYIITDGLYNFNLLNIINKDFQIQEGSRIDWYGDPADATINIDAFYFIKNVPLKGLNLYPDEKRNTEVSCFIEITGTLLSPDLKLKIELPQSTDETYLQIIKTLSEKDMNEQFLSLILMRSFISVNGSDQNLNTDPSGFIQNALNSVIKKTGYNVSFNYESGKIFTDKYKVEISRTIWDDRIEIKGGVEYGGTDSTSTNGTSDKYLGEFEIEGKLNDKGTIRLKGYNKPSNKKEYEGVYTQGVGIVWRGKFNTLFHRKERENQIMKDSVRIYKYNPE